MEAAVVSVAHGAMGSLLGKLGELLTAKYKLLKETRGHIMFLIAELESMHVLLKKISDIEEPDMQDKHWAKEVRELSYDIEDSVTEFMLRVESKSCSKPCGFKGFINRSLNLLTTINTRHEIAKEFKVLKERVLEVSERRTRYKIDDVVPQPSNTTIDHRLLALHAEATELIGINAASDYVIKLMDEEDVPAHKLKVLSIVGFGGIGKTTLANDIYRKLEEKFQCQAFVPVSQNPNVGKILRAILSQVGYKAPEGSSMETWEGSELIAALRKFLRDKRYFIVIDDIWDIQSWNTIKLGFPENTSGSIVIITTRIQDVARVCCINNSKYVYRMKPLSEQDSRRLFFKRIFGSEDSCPTYLQEVASVILRKCGGIPLAITIISSLLASQPNNKLMEQWEYIRNSLGSNFAANQNLKDMRKILNLSYVNLPHHLKACILYLSIYPEDHIIEKDDLARQWVAEGFISKAHATNPEDIARSYFNELINRSMIQPTSIDYNGEVMSCKVHDMMLELISYICKEENFVSAPYYFERLTAQFGNIRRLSLNGPGVIDDRLVESVQLSQTRTLARFSNSTYLPPFLLFKHLRVLTIEISVGNISTELLDLSGICHLFLLRYIKVIAKGHGVVLPSKIGGLKQLETFEIDVTIKSSKGQSFLDLPSDIVDLSRLLHLIVPDYVLLPNGIGKMKSLCTLRLFSMSNSLNRIKDLGELTNLTNLEIVLGCGDITKDMLVERCMEVLGTCVKKLCSLKYLYISTYPIYIYIDPLSSIPASFCDLRRFHGYYFSRVPRWISGLNSLYALELGVEEVEEKDVRALAHLHSLIHLKLILSFTPQDKVVVPGSGFPVLKHFMVSCPGISFLTFESGAMPSLERLGLRFNAGAWYRCGAPNGINQLSCLKEISLGIWGSLSGSCRSDAESTLKDAVGFNVNITFGMWGVPEVI